MSRQCRKPSHPAHSHNRYPDLCSDGKFSASHLTFARGTPVRSHVSDSHSNLLLTPFSASTSLAQPPPLSNSTKASSTALLAQVFQSPARGIPGIRHITRITNSISCSVACCSKVRSDSGLATGRRDLKISRNAAEMCFTACASQSMPAAVMRTTARLCLLVAMLGIGGAVGSSMGFFIVRMLCNHSGSDERGWRMWQTGDICLWSTTRACILGAEKEIAEQLHWYLRFAPAHSLLRSRRSAGTTLPKPISSMKNRPQGTFSYCVHAPRTPSNHYLLRHIVITYNASLTRLSPSTSADQPPTPSNNTTASVNASPVHSFQLAAPGIPGM